MNGNFQTVHMFFNTLQNKNNNNEREDEEQRIQIYYDCTHVPKQRVLHYTIYNNIFFI